MHWLTLPLVLLGTWITWATISLHRNYRKALAIRLPIVVALTNVTNPLWILAYKVFPAVLPVLQALPFNLGRWSKYTYGGWTFDDKNKIHDELGPAFVVCQPGGLELVVADPAACHQILLRRKDFIKPAIMYDALNVFGKNLDTVEGEAWQRHRKITAPNFNESVSSSVWDESLRQATQMLRLWTASVDGTRDVVDDTAALALNVLTYAGFGVQYAFTNAEGTIPQPHQMTYRRSLYLILRHFTLLILVPMYMLNWQIVPRSIRQVGTACNEFKLYMKELVADETAAIANGSGSERHKNLLAALVHASRAADRGLSDEELYGNLFIYSFAGHETTANTLATAIAYLAAAPKWQDWIHWEISTVTDSSVDATSWKFEDIYHRLIRCQAVMYETLRLHGSVVAIPKITGGVPQLLTITKSQHTIPPSTFVTVNSQALHCNTQIWGADALEWRPDRWITKTGDTGKEELKEVEPGTFVGWADGPRVCPGRRFSQVEFAGVLAVLFCAHTVAPKPDAHENDDRARERVRRMIDDSGISAITLQMNRPRDVAFLWKPRK